MFPQSIMSAISDIQTKTLKISAIGSHSLPTKSYIKIAELIGGNYNQLNKFQKTIFRASALDGIPMEFDYYLNL